MAVNKKLLQGAAAAAGEFVPSEHFGVVLYEGDGSSSHSINGGKFGAAFYGNGSNSRIDVSSIGGFPSGNEPRTISFWMYSDSYANGGIVAYGTASSNQGFAFYISSSQLIMTFYAVNANINYALSTGQWYHVVATHDGTTFKAYINGSEEYSDTRTLNTGTAGFRIGGVPWNNSSEFFNGKIDQVRVFSKALSSSEVSTLYAETASTVESLDPLSEDTTDTLQVLGDSSCVAAYQFENDETDLSGNYDGTGTEIQYAAGRYGQAASFNGSSSYVSLSNASTMLGTPAGQTISCWAKFNSVASTGFNNTALLTANNSSNPKWQITLYDGKIYGDYTQETGVFRQRGGSTSISANTWYHFVVTFDSTDSNVVQFYVNGQAETATNINSGGTFTGNILNPNVPINIGYRPAYGNTWFMDGEIDQVRIFNKVLSASEVTTLYQENSLVASYRFEGNSSDDTRNYDGTASNVTYEYGLNFTPDFVWIKGRTSADNNFIFDTTRGDSVTVNTNLTAAQYADTGVTSFDTGGFTVGSGAGENRDGDDYVAWCLKANGGTTSTNTDGSITSTVQANQDAGFSIVTYTGTGSNATVGHELGVQPYMVITKGTDTVVGLTNWKIYHNSLGGTKSLTLNSTAAASTSSTQWNDTDATSSVFSLGTSGDMNGNGAAYIAYCFAPIDGFSKFGSYTGTGSATDRPIIETGFEPAFVMIKNTSATGSWMIHDNKRNLTNPRDGYLRAESSNAEGVYAEYGLDFFSNGFQIGPTTNYHWNTSGNTYIYMAFAADPDTEAPTVAKSFSTVTYDGNGTSQSITGLGFQPNLVWIKQRNGTNPHGLWDSVRGAGKLIKSNTTEAQTGNEGDLLGSFDSDGFQVNRNYLTFTAYDNTNYGLGDYVAWAWKADDNEPTIFGGPAVAVYKLNGNANDVTGNYNGTASSSSYSSGKFGNAFDCANTRYINISSLPALSSTRSVSLWVKASSVDYNDRLFGYFGGTSYFNISFGANNNISAYTGGIVLTSANNSINTGQWHHIVLVANGTTGKLYIDGVEVVSTTITSYSITPTAAYIGTNEGNVGVQIPNALIDQVRIYNGAIAQEQVTELYNETAADNDDLTLGGPPETIISANANAGFSIVKYEGTGVSGTRIPHGLSSAPELWIGKQLSGSSINWQVLYSGFSEGDYLDFNTVDAKANSANVTFDPTATTVKFHGNQALNDSGEQYIGYAFHSVSGFSKIGTYTGTGSTGNSVNVGFQPDFVMQKKTSGSGSWNIIDSLRGDDNYLSANLSNAEGSMTASSFHLTSTGFTLDNSFSEWNASGATYIYMAFKIN